MTDITPNTDPETVTPDHAATDSTPDYTEPVVIKKDGSTVSVADDTVTVQGPDGSTTETDGGNEFAALLHKISAALGL